MRALICTHLCLRFELLIFNFFKFDIAALLPLLQNPFTAQCNKNLKRLIEKIKDNKVTEL